MPYGGTVRKLGTIDLDQVCEHEDCSINYP